MDTSCCDVLHPLSSHATQYDGLDLDFGGHLQEHPGGANSLLRRAGGVKDYTEDFRFHSIRGRKMWDKFEIGLLDECSASETTTRRRTRTSPWWMYWNQ